LAQTGRTEISDIIVEKTLLGTEIDMESRMKAKQNRDGNGQPLLTDRWKSPSIRYAWPSL
jgi:hypothetical protein